MVRADLFSGFLTVWSVRDGAAHFAPPRQSRAGRDSGRIPFGLFLKYTLTGVQGIEPWPTVLETVVLPLNYTPQWQTTYGL